MEADGQREQQEQHKQQEQQDEGMQEPNGQEQPKPAGESDRESRLASLYNRLRSLRNPPDTDPYLEFWDEAAASVPVPKEPRHAGEPTGASAAPPGRKPTPSKYNGRNSRARQRAEKEVPKLFLEQAKNVATDELTWWAEMRMAAYASFMDIPTAVSILKDLESPSEVHEYVEQFFGSGQEAVEFGNAFLQRREKCRKKSIAAKLEDPVVLPPRSEATYREMDDAGAGQAEGSGRSTKKKTRMVKVDKSDLGFTVRAGVSKFNARK